MSYFDSSRSSLAAISPITADQEVKKSKERRILLEAVAQAYYIDKQGQAEVAGRFGCTRSAVSRLLSEARDTGVIEIKINREFSLDHELATRLGSISKSTRVYVVRSAGLDEVLAINQVSEFAAGVIYGQLRKGCSLGITMGTTVHSTARALARLRPISIDVVQMCGSMGASIPVVDGQETVKLLADAYACQASYLRAPFLVDDASMREALRRNRANSICIKRSRAASIALVGLGTVKARNSSLALGGHIPRTLLRALEHGGAVGDVAGYAIDASGTLVENALYTPMLAVDYEEFQAIPIRIGVAAGRQKANLIVAALRGGILSEMIIDSEVAEAAANILGEK